MVTRYQKALIQAALVPYMAAPLAKSTGPALNTWIDATAPAPVDVG